MAERRRVGGWETDTYGGRNTAGRQCVAAPGEHLGPYTVYFVFALGALAAQVPLSMVLMRHPVAGRPVGLRDYAQGRVPLHLWGIAGGLIWGLGTISNFVVSSVPFVGPATSFALGQGNTMISAIWSIFVWKEFRGAGAHVNRLLALMFLFFVLGLASIALAPILASH